MIPYNLVAAHMTPRTKGFDALITSLFHYMNNFFYINQTLNG